MGHIVGLPDAPHDAGTLARRILKLFTLPSALHLAVNLTPTVVNYIGHITAILFYILRLPAALLHATLTSLPAQRCMSCQSCILMLAASTPRSSAHITWTHGPGPVLAALGYLVGGAISVTSCATTLCVTAGTIHAALTAVPRITRALTRRLRRARGRVSPLIPPGSPPPWDTSTIHTRQVDFNNHPNWEGRFAGARRTCYSHLVSAISDWHLP